MASKFLTLVLTIVSSAATKGAFPDANAAFACTRVTTCIGGFPGCGSLNTTTTHTMDFAIDADLQAQILGPVASLPLALNQQLLYRWDLSAVYLIWVDVRAGSTPSKRRVINCTKGPANPLTPKQIRESLLGFSFRAAPNGTAPCSLSSSAMGECQRWQWISTFGCSSVGTKPVMGTEPEVWRVKAPAANGTNFTIASMTNTILKPASCPGVRRSYATVDYTKNWRASDAGDFALPPQCHAGNVTEVTTLPWVDPALLMPNKPSGNF